MGRTKASVLRIAVGCRIRFAFPCSHAEPRPRLKEGGLLATLACFGQKPEGFCIVTLGSSMEQRQNVAGVPAT